MEVGVEVSVLLSILPADIQGSKMPVHQSHLRFRYWPWASRPYAFETVLDFILG